MSLIKRGKTWWIDFTAPGGNRIRCSAKTTVKREAQTFHDKLRRDAWERDRLGIQSGRTWDEAALKWVKTTENTVSYKKNLSKLRWLHPYLSGRSLDSITQGYIEEIVAIKEDETSGATANRFLAVISVVLHQAHKWEWIVRVPHIQRYKEIKKRVRWLTNVEYHRLMMALPDYLKPMVKFSVATGLRQGNVKNLEWSQVDVRRHCAWIHADQSKSDEPISVPLNQNALDALAAVKGKHGTLVFVSKTGEWLGDPNNRDWRKALDTAGIEDFRWHDLRHTWASWHVQNGTPLYVLKELGGWKTLAMVEKYAHLAPQHLAAYVDNVMTDVA